MNNRTQQRFDRSIHTAVAATRAALDATPRRNVTPPRASRPARQPKGRLYLDPLTGATVFAPSSGATMQSLADATTREGLKHFERVRANG